MGDEIWERRKWGGDASADDQIGECARKTVRRTGQGRRREIDQRSNLSLLKDLGTKAKSRFSNKGGYGWVKDVSRKGAWGSSTQGEKGNAVGRRGKERNLTRAEKERVPSF